MLVRSLRFTLAVLVVSLLSPLASAQDRDLWYRMLMQDAPVGYVHTTEKTSGGKITTTNLSKVSIKRGTIAINIEMSSEFVETLDGTPISASAVQKMGAIPSITMVAFDTDKKVMKVASVQGGAESTSEKPLPQGWLPPAAAGRYMKKQLAAGEKTIEYSTMDLTTGVAVFKLTHKVGEVEKITVSGKEMEGRRIEVTNSIMPSVVTTEHVDADLTPLRTLAKMGAIPVVTELADASVAGEKSDKSPELMVSTFVVPDKPIDNARKTSKATYLLSMPAGEVLAIPSAGPQSASAIDAQTTRVVVDQKNPAPVQYTPDARSKFLASTAAVNLEDEEIRKLSAKSLQDAAGSPSDRAEACRRFVYRYINAKSLDTAFATASEVARNRGGDCSEHGVLLVALLRAAGIPARGVVGLIYADAFAGREKIFGYHMWAQALLTIDGKERWVDFDATLPPQSPTDATHIALGYTDFSDEGSLASMTGVAAAMGQLKIKVESVE
ncbi:MAG: transglutaminase family protein [Phycisphaerae bacterium]|nr:transglutaminase family protein [Phycisphaerae bacterium]